MPGTFEQKAVGDIRLSINSKRIIKAHTELCRIKFFGWIWRRVAFKIADIYYKAVKYGGAEAFWADKSMPDAVVVEVEV